MSEWISNLLIFSAGVAVGVLVNIIKPYFSIAKQQRTALVKARARILRDIKNRHEKEILDEAFRTTEAIRGELARSLRKLTKMLDMLLAPADPPRNGQKLIHLTDPIKSNQSPS